MNETTFITWQRHLLKWEGRCIPAEGESLVHAYDRCRDSAFADDPRDSGGATMMGITLRTYDAWRRAYRLQQTPATAEQLRQMPYEEWRQLIETCYWRMYAMHIVSFECLALVFADGIFMSGRAGIREMQRALGCEPDGIVGVKTRAAMRTRIRLRATARNISGEVLTGRLARLQGLSRWQTFGRGWTNRIEDLRALINTLDLTEDGE